MVAVTQLPHKLKRRSGDALEEEKAQWRATIDAKIEKADGDIGSIKEHIVRIETGQLGLAKDSVFQRATIQALADGQHDLRVGQDGIKSEITDVKTALEANTAMTAEMRDVFVLAKRAFSAFGRVFNFFASIPGWIVLHAKRIAAVGAVILVMFQLWDSPTFRQVWHDAQAWWHRL